MSLVLNLLSAFSVDSRYCFTYVALMFSVCFPHVFYCLTYGFTQCSRGVECGNPQLSLGDSLVLTGSLTLLTLLIYLYTHTFKSPSSVICYLLYVILFLSFSFSLFSKISFDLI
ncbi:hypothetical protein J3R30DRAFT_3507544 [Lentinula aciculospora]|uniref:Uncharacterized protein n=1 Tax=Lentinula aciculospora TaxID=153920 RepID=A0A9W9A5V7_9AGAR|nr:hypothetical protein J3R30DRAFT_3507544 [Lentinula aciculospora]